MEGVDCGTGWCLETDHSGSIRVTMTTSQSFTLPAFVRLAYREWLQLADSVEKVGFSDHLNSGTVTPENLLTTLRGFSAFRCA
jgi:hypothetical protein